MRSLHPVPHVHRDTKAFAAVPHSVSLQQQTRVGLRCASLLSEHLSIARNQNSLSHTHELQGLLTRVLLCLTSSGSLLQRLTAETLHIDKSVAVGLTDGEERRGEKSDSNPFVHEASFAPLS